MARLLGMSVFAGMLASVGSFNSASAQTTPPPAESPPPVAAATASVPNPDPVNSINGNPLGALIGSYGLNYERLMGGMHGLMIEGQLGIRSDSSSSYTTYGGGAGYRWHWRGRQNSGFLGLMAGYSVGTGKSTVSDGAGGTQNFDLTIKAPWVVGNIGKRWVLPYNLNITFRIGAGWAGYKVSTTSTDPDAQAGVDLLQDLLTFLPIAFDGEISLGYMF